MGGSLWSYGLRVRAIEVALWLTTVAFLLSQGVLLAAVWVIEAVAPHARSLARRTADLIGRADLLMDDDERRAPTAASAAADGKADGKPAPAVVDGVVVWVRTEDKERVA